MKSISSNPELPTSKQPESTANSLKKKRTLERQTKENKESKEENNKKLEDRRKRIADIKQKLRDREKQMTKLSRSTKKN